MGSSWKKTLYSTCIAQFIAMLGFGFVFPFMPFFILKLGVKEGPAADKWCGILVMSTGLAMALFSPIWGMVADRYGRKNMVLRAMIGGAITLALMAFARNVTDLLILRILQGVLAGTVTANMALVASITPPEHAGYSLGMIAVAISSGNCIGPLVGGYSAKLFGYRPTFIVAGALLMVGSLIVKFGTEENFERHESSRSGVAGSFLPLLAIGSFLVPMLALCMVNFAAAAPAPIFPYFIKSISALADEDAAAMTGVIISVVGVVDAAGAWMFGRFGDQWGHKKVLMFAVVLGGVAACAQAWSQTIAQLLALRVMFAFGMAGILPTANAIIRRTVPDHSMGKAFGLVAALNSLGWAFGPLVGAYTAVFMMSYRPVFTLSGVLLCLISLFVAWKVKEHPVEEPGRAEEGAATVEP